MSDARFSIIPGWIVTDPRLKGRDLQVLCLLGRHTSSKSGWCRRSQVKMAEELSLARSTVQASIDRLIEIGGVERQVVVSESGRDSAHWYRVVYDRAASRDAFDAWDVEDEKEFGPISDADDADTPCRYVGTPAGISAPPAGLGSAPPADSGPAPINDSTLTASAEPKERERERDDGIGEESPKAIERTFRRWFATWPTFVADSEDEARREWGRLVPHERLQAADLTEAYVAAVKAAKRTAVCAAAVYLREKRWLKLPAKAAIDQTPVAEGPFGKGWGALRLVELLQPHKPLPPPPRFVQQMITSGKLDQRGEERERMAKFGWPAVTEMHERATGYRGVMVPGSIKALGAEFVGVKVGGDLWEAWKRLHEARGWPRLPDTGKQQFVYFPAIPEGHEGDWDSLVAAAIEAFAAKVREVRGDEHAA